MKKLLFMVFIALGITGCKKDKLEYEAAAFEVLCSNCSVTYNNDGPQLTQTVNTSFKKDLKHPSNANITVKANGNATFQLYLTNLEVYSITMNGTKTFSYDYKSNTLNDGSSTRSFGTPSSSSSNSKRCGAATKNGGSCQRLVSGGGYCWQHR